eukprot:5943223-Prymnesium_polylepis.2
MLRHLSTHRTWPDSAVVLARRIGRSELSVHEVDGLEGEVDGLEGEGDPMLSDARKGRRSAKSSCPSWFMSY